MTTTVGDQHRRGFTSHYLWRKLADGRPADPIETFDRSATGCVTAGEHAHPGLRGKLAISIAWSC